MREGEEWLYYGCENAKSLATFVRARRHLEVLFFEFSILENQKRGGKWVGKIELPHVACFHWSEKKAPEDDPRRTEGDGCVKHWRMIRDVPKEMDA